MKSASERVLIVDDEPNIVVAIAFLLERKGFLIERAYDGVEAIEKASVFKIGRAHV